MLEPHAISHACPLLAVAALTLSCERLVAPACPRDVRAVASADRPTSFPKPSTVVRYIPAAFVGERSNEPVALTGSGARYEATLSDQEASWYVGKLIDYGEASISERASDPQIEVYRVLQLPSLAVVGDFTIRVERRGNQALVEAKRSSLCESDGKHGVAVATTQRGLTDGPWRELAACMERVFWSAPVADDVEGVDGSDTVFEGVRQGKYHVVRRWTLESEANAPERKGLLQCRALFIAAAGWSQDVLVSR
jgi:hypothetical protein